MQVIKRDELYARIWARPLTAVAAELGVTGTALKKACLRHQIPTPPRGHWTRLKHCKPSPMARLPAMKDPRLAQVRIVGDLEKRLPAAVLSARAVARQGPAAPAEMLAGDHPALLRTRKALSRVRPDGKGFLTVVGKGILPSTLAPASIDRAIGWLGLLFRSLEAHGKGWRKTDDGLLLEVDGEPVGVSLIEQPDRILHEPTPKELKLKAERSSWGYRADPWPKYDERPSGRLALVIAGNDWSGLRRTFADGKTQRLEAMLPVILGGLAAHAALTRGNREKAEAAAKVRAEADVRRRAEVAFREREKRRGELVEAIAAKLAERQRLVGVLTHLEAMGGDAPETIAAIAAWVKQRVTGIDALTGPTFLDLSARSAEVEFDEAKLSPEATSEKRFYGREPELRFWSLDEAVGVAAAISPAEWHARCAPGERPPGRR
jgi:hypothetical protein